LHVYFKDQTIDFPTNPSTVIDMAETPKGWGVTGSISLARPTEEEVSANAALIEELKSQGSFESAEESQRR
jgi:poly(A) polymerase Pap1